MARLIDANSSFRRKLPLQLANDREGPGCDEQAVGCCVLIYDHCGLMGIRWFDQRDLA